MIDNVLTRGYLGPTSAAEMQAIDRTHRLGQYRPIRAVRFIAEGTVEERVLQLQEKKRLVFDGTVGRYVELAFSL